MDVPSYLLAKRYAQAYLATIAEHITLEDIYGIERCVQRMAVHKDLFTYLAMPIIEVDKKVAMMQALSKACAIDIDIGPLVALLLEDGRIGLLKEVLHYCALLYKRNNAIQSFAITSSHALDQRDCMIIKKFLEQATGSTIVYSHNVDSTLIAGIRLQSDTLLWEYSINKQLHQLHLMFGK